MFSFQNAWPIKIKAVYTLVLFHITVFIHFLVWLWSQLVYFLKLQSYFILVNLQLVAGGKKYCSAGKFYWSLPDKETTTNPKSLWINNVKMTQLQVEKKRTIQKQWRKHSSWCRSRQLNSTSELHFQHKETDWLDYVKMTPQKVMGARMSSMIQHLSWGPHLKRLWLDNVKMTPQKVMGAGISSIIQHLTSAPQLKRPWLYKVKMTPQKVMDARISSLIHHVKCAPNLKRLWLDNVKMTPQKVMDAGISSLIKHMNCAPNPKRLWLDYVKMTPQKVMGAGISSMIHHVLCAPNLKRLWLDNVKMTP